MSGSLDGAAVVIGLFALFGLAAVGAVVVGVLAMLGLSTLTRQFSKISEADEVIQRELERIKLEEMAGGEDERR